MKIEETIGVVYKTQFEKNRLIHHYRFRIQFLIKTLKLIFVVKMDEREQENRNLVRWIELKSKEKIK